MASESDRLLVRQIRAGDARAWEQLVEQFEGRLLAFALHKLRNRTAAEDVVQDTFVGFLTSLANFDERRELQTWLFTIASYKITDQLRRSGRRSVQTGDSAEERMGEQSDDKQRMASSLARSAEKRELENTALARALRQVIDGMRDREEWLRLQVLELLFVKGWPNKDAAKHTGVSEQQVANYRFAAVKKIGELIAGAGLSVDVFPELR